MAGLGRILNALLLFGVIGLHNVVFVLIEHPILLKEAFYVVEADSGGNIGVRLLGIELQSEDKSVLPWHEQLVPHCVHVTRNCLPNR